MDRKHLIRFQSETSLQRSVDGKHFMLFFRVKPPSSNFSSAVWKEPKPTNKQTNKYIMFGSENSDVAVTQNEFAIR